MGKCRSSQPGQKYYQLTHDYLVPALRDWLTRKQKETRRGVAELLLADRAAVWNARRENRQLPSLLHWFQIKWLTAKKNWTPPQRNMMRMAARYHVVRGVAVVVLLGLLGFVGGEGFGRLTAHQLCDRMLESTTADAPKIINDADPFRRWTNPLLRKALAEAERDGNKRRQLHASLALLPVDPEQVQYLQARLLQGDPEEVLVIRQALLDHQQKLTNGLWELLEKASADQDQRFRAAGALAAFDPDDARWDKVRDEVAGKLAAQKPFEVARWTEVFKPVRKAMLPPLAASLEDEKRSPAERSLIANIYGNYAADVPEAYARLEKRLADASAPDALAEKKLELTKKQANIGVGLLVMGRGDKVWPLLKHSPDPTLRSFLIERMGPGGVDARLLLARLDEEKDASIRMALLLSLGEYKLNQLPLAERQVLLPRMLDLYRNDPDPRMHGAARWLLKQWEAHAKIKEIDEASRVASSSRVKRGWFVNGQGQTMVLIPKPSEGVYWVGEGAARPMAHNFAISSDNVTVEQFQRFWPAYKPNEHYAPTKECPAMGVSWYDAAAYCNWLSQREGIIESQWCYEIKRGPVSALTALAFAARTSSLYMYGDQVKIKAGYLGLQGYRLPTELEWEHACRAGSTVGYSFGEPTELLEKYAWYDRNSLGQAHPVGMLKPNDLGLFDMHGNASQWMNGVFTDKVAEKENDRGELVEEFSQRVFRGGSWFHDSGYSRAAGPRQRISPNAETGSNGFRLVRVPVEASGK